MIAATRPYPAHTLRVVTHGAIRKAETVTAAGTLAETVTGARLLPGDPAAAVKGDTVLRAALRCFTHHPGRLVTVDDILDALQPDPFRPRPSASCARKAVAKLRRDMPIRTIHTRPGGWVYEVTL